MPVTDASGHRKCQWEPLSNIGVKNGYSRKKDLSRFIAFRCSVSSLEENGLKKNFLSWVALVILKVIFINEGKDMKWDETAPKVGL